MPFCEVRCVSPVGRIGPSIDHEQIVEKVGRERVRVGIIPTDQAGTYDLTVEGDVLLGEDPETDVRRVEMLIARVTQQADALEQHQLPGKDQPVEVFEEDLKKEGR